MISQHPQMWWEHTLAQQRLPDSSCREESRRLPASPLGQCSSRTLLQFLPSEVCLGHQRGSWCAAEHQEEWEIPWERLPSLLQLCDCPLDECQVDKDVGWANWEGQFVEEFLGLLNALGFLGVKAVGDHLDSNQVICVKADCLNPRSLSKSIHSISFDVAVVYVRQILPSW